MELQWNNEINVAVWITIFWFLIIFVNIFGTLGYAEEEFWASLFKLLAIIVFMIVAVVLICGGGPSIGKFLTYWGARLWYDPGAFQNGFLGFCGVFISAAFAFAGTELVGLAAAEVGNPTKALPLAIKQVFWRITVFYIVGLTLVGMLVSSTDDRLLNAKNPFANGTSPFVLAVKDAGLVGYDSFMNVVILASVMSIGVSAVFGGSRTLTALAQQGYAPRLFCYIDRSGRPLWSVVLHLSFGALAYIVLASSGQMVFNWLQALSTLAVIFSWASICLAHIRFRAAWKAAGRTIDDIPFRALFGVTGSWVSLLLLLIVLIAQFYTAIAPLKADAFFQAYLGVPIVLLFWAGAYLWKRQGFLKLHQIDLDTGRREQDWDTIIAHRQKIAGMPAWRRLWNKLF